MLRNRLNDNGFTNDYRVDAGCAVNGPCATRASLRAMRSRLRMQRIQLSETAIQTIGGKPEEEHGTEPSETPTRVSLRAELPSPIWASLVLGRA